MLKQPDDPSGSYSRRCLCCGVRRASTCDVLCSRCEPESWIDHLLRRVYGRECGLVRRIKAEWASFCAWLGGEL